MQMDKTHIVIRERSMLDIMDLALHVLWVYFTPVMLTFALGAIPFFLINDLLLVGWQAVPINLDFYTEDDIWMCLRFIWTMSMLVFVQAQVASAFTTLFLGKAIFLEQPTARKLIVEVLRFSGRIFWCQLILRGVLPVCLLVAVAGMEEDVSGVEIMLLPTILLVVAILRASRPFINEIILLEMNPLIAKPDAPITIGRRSNRLHGPSSGDLFSRWLGCATLGFCLVAAVYGGSLFCHGVLTSDWSYPPYLVRYLLPLSMWLVACYFAVVRFLAYLDLRIRQEGWEVELRLRAEAARMNHPFARKTA